MSTCRPVVVHIAHRRPAQQCRGLCGPQVARCLPPHLATSSAPQVNGTNEKLRKAVAAAQKQVSRYEAELEEVQRQLASTQTAFAAKETQVGDRDRHLEWHKNKLESTAADLQAARAELAGTATRLREAREEGDQIREDYKRLVTAMQTAEADSRVAVQRLEDRGAAAQTALKHEQDTLAACRAELRSKVDELSQANSRIAALERDLANRRADLADVTRQRAELHEAAAGAEGLQQALAQETQARKALERENAMVVAASESLSATLEEARARLTLLGAEAATAATAREQLAAEGAGLAATLAGSTAAWEAGMNDLRAQLAASNAQLAAEAALVHKRDRELEELRSQGAAADAQAQDLQRQLADARGEVATAADRAAGLQTELRDAAAAALLQQRKQAHAVKDLGRQLQQANRRMETMQASAGGGTALPMGGTAREEAQRGRGGMLSQGQVPRRVPDAAPSLLPTSPAGSVSGSSRRPSNADGGGGGGSRDREGHAALASAGEDAGVKGAHRRHASAGGSGNGKTAATLQAENQALVGRLCTMRQAAERAEEKMAFYEEHVRDLTVDLEEKTHIIRQYLLREQRGMFPREQPPSPAAASPKKRSAGGGLKALFGVGRPAGALEGGEDGQLSATVVRKLQEVLEDTLTKNMQLQDNVDHLSRQVQQQQQQQQQQQNRS